MTKTCPHCDQVYEAKRPEQKFCSRSCNAHFHNSHRVKVRRRIKTPHLLKITFAMCVLLTIAMSGLGYVVFNLDKFLTVEILKNDKINGHRESNTD